MSCSNFNNGKTFRDIETVNYPAELYKVDVPFDVPFPPYPSYPFIDDRQARIRETQIHEKQIVYVPPRMMRWNFGCNCRRLQPQGVILTP